MILKAGLLGIFLCLSISGMANSNLAKMKEQYRSNWIQVQKVEKGFPMVGIGDRLEADVLLELAGEGYEEYTDYIHKTKKNLIHSDEILLIMPRIDLLERYLPALASTTGQVLVFLMEDDKLEGEYGDRSYQTYIEKGLESHLPKNVKVFPLKNESVTQTGIQNNFEFSAIQNSLVYKNQILPLYQKYSKIKRK